ncbi:MAG TPA: HD domain-containing phosphohydrolase [Anaerolineaceae bacterium]|nr:HD domain-containing phosphohydrolase [Anaerolineaceae bacterium]HPN50422.1 HD domain-containing phosphohydrolase [Anaerolineaceae bacterium]
MLCLVLYEVVYMMGGTSTAGPHLFYFPILFAAMTGSWWQVLITALLAAFLMSGPMMPLSVANHTSQSLTGWLLRGGFFLGIGFFVYFLHDTLQQREIELGQKSHQMLSFERSAFKAILNLAENRDPDATGQHLKRMAYYAELLLQELDMPPQLKKDIISAIPLHDIGKVAIQDQVLLKPGPLTGHEFNEIKKHPEIGGKILMAIEESAGAGEFISFVQTARELTYYHHERVDGTGYPEGLKGANIPLSARITAVCDVYDALATRRPYKEPLPHEECVRIIREGAGTQFDPQIVEAFLRAEQKFKGIAAHYADKARSESSPGIPVHSGSLLR